ncbi:MAG: D-glycero-alpha-D-manno-heptose-1,7-bisphosphate 7-phosphatase [Chthoniobacterales bacterium]
MTGWSSDSWPAVFLDRDGTLMRDVDYCGDPANVEVFPEATDALRRLKQNGYKIVIVTNQSGIARGYFTEQQYREVEAEFVRQLGEGLIDASYYCPALPGSGSVRRKPGPGMIFEAQSDHRIDLRRSFMVGDKASDIGCGENAGVRTILVQTGYGAQQKHTNADWVARDISHAVDIILEQQ